MKTPGEEARLAAMDAARNMSTWEYFRTRQRSKNTYRRLKNGKKIRPKGYHRNPSVMLGSFGDIDYGH